MLRENLNEIQFYLRSTLLGKIPLRPGLPRLEISHAIRMERHYYHLILSKVFNPKIQIDRLVDVGCRNWSYAQALADFFPNAELIGIELDGKRRYWNLYRRKDQAEAYVQELLMLGKNASFLDLDFMKFRMSKPKTPEKQNVDLICFFYPFVSWYPCAKWGLPKKYADFSALLNHALEMRLQMPEGRQMILSVHQGEWESEEAHRAYQRAGISVRELILSVEETAPYWPSSYETRICFSE